MNKCKKDRRTYRKAGEKQEYKIEKMEPIPIKEERVDEIEQIYNKKENDNENDNNLKIGKGKNNSGFFLLKRKSVE